MRHWRLLLRDAVTALLIATPLLLLGLTVLVSRFPDHAWVRAARGWPVVSPVIRYLASSAGVEEILEPESRSFSPTQARTLISGLEIWLEEGTRLFAAPAGRPTDTLAVPTRLEVMERQGAWVRVAGRHHGWVEVPAGDPRMAGDDPSQHRTVWVRPGFGLFMAPGGDVVAEADSIANLAVVEVGQDDWVQVIYQDRKLWLRAPEFTGGPPPLGSATRPIRPLEAAEIDPARLRTARELFAAAPSEARSGPYRLLGDSPRVVTVAAGCGERLAAVDQDFARATGVTPLGIPRETLLLFSDRPAYRAFISMSPAPSSDPDGYAVVAQGLAATCLASRSDSQVCSVLVHEATHLTARRAFGPALPPWLTEGLAAWIEGRPLAAVDPTLGRELVRMDDEAFYADDLDHRYRLTAAIARALLIDMRFRSATRAFLRDRASGLPLADGPGFSATGFWLALIEELHVPEQELWRALSGPGISDPSHNTATNHQHQH